MEWKQTDRRTDTTDCISANAVGKYLFTVGILDFSRMVQSAVMHHLSKKCSNLSTVSVAT